MKDNLGDLVFFRVFGNSPRNRVLMFFIENNEFDYSKSDIAELAGVSRVTLNSFIGEFLKTGMIVKTREIGRAKLYKINLDNPIVKQLIELNEITADKYADLITKKEKVPA